MYVYIPISKRVNIGFWGFVEEKFQVFKVANTEETSPRANNIYEEVFAKIVNSPAIVSHISQF